MSKNILDLFADVVVFAPTDPTKSFFTYSIPKKISKGIGTDVPDPKGIAIGQLISVPWGKKTTNGIVIEIKGETQIKKPKEVKKILSPTPILLPNYIKLLRWMSWYYHASMLDCLKAMFPEIPLNAKRLMTNATRQTKNISHSALDVKQTLVLVPTINQIQVAVNKLKVSKGIVTYHKTLKKKELWKTWWQIYLGKANKIIGTRAALFTQIPNLVEIRIISEEDSGFKNVQSPYFDTLTVAAKLAEICGAKLRIETLTPKVETYFKFGKKLTKKRFKSKPQITIINLWPERKKNRKSVISDTLRYRLIEKINKKKSVLLFLNRVKESGQVYCSECKYSGYLPIQPDSCPNCKGVNFKFYSINLGLVALEVEKFLPQVGLKLVTEGGAKKIKAGKPTIILTTSAIFSTKAKKFSLIGVVSADTILNLPDFASSFRTFSTLVKLSQLADKDGEVLIQTYNPKHSAIQAVLGDFERYYAEELILRKKLELPPFSILSKLSLKLKSEEKAGKEAEKLVEILAKKSLLVEVSGPIQNWQGKSEFNIIVKAKQREDLDNVLDFVPAKWKVVVDPESLL